MKISIIVAMSVNRVIGKGKSLPWKLPADLRHFKELTMGHWVVLGRKTFESIGRPLPGRRLIVVTHQVEYSADGVEIAHSVDQALSVAEGGEVFIAGGGQIYNQTIGRADRIYITLVEREFEGDTRFPPLDASNWQQVFEECHQADEKNPVPYRFQIYERNIKTIG
ncbi:MAG TPA: type 3 dihydrofolate reductase [Terriglobia bacterium]|nr:type 3 dihydrofolate reductase [Terriglobia bacterium]